MRPTGWVVKRLVPPQTPVSPPKPASKWLLPTKQLTSAVLVTLVAAALAELIREYFNIPNPLVLMLLAVIFVTVRSGSSAGLVSAGMVAAYGLMIFLLRHSIPVATASVSRELMICIVAPATAIMVGALKKRQERDERALHASEMAERIALEREHNARLLAEAHEAQLRLLAAELERGVAARTAELRESEFRYRTVLAATPDGIALQRADFTIAAWNEAAERMTGLTEEQLSGVLPRPAGWRAIREDGSAFEMTDHPSLVALRTDEPQLNCVMGVQHPDGRLVWISMNTVPLTHEGETVPYAAVTSFADVTARREAEAALRESEQRYQLLAMQAPVGIFHTDSEGSFTFVNERFCAITLSSHQGALGDGWQQIVHLDDRARVTVQWLAAARSGRAFRQEFRLRTLAGETLWVEATAEAVRSEIGVVTGYLGSVHDLSERKHAEDALRALSLRDDLTGVWNRRGFYKLAEQEVRRAKARGLTLLVMYADVNAFKSINDVHGHGAGDDALIAVAVALQSASRGIDIVGRLGGDEFVVLSVHETVDAARAAETGMRARIGANISTAANDRPYSLTLSLGAALGTGADAALETLLANADESLYATKRRRVTLTPLAVAS